MSRAYRDLCSDVTRAALCRQVLGELDEFERAVRLVLKDVRLDADLVVSVFETNIRMLG